MEQLIGRESETRALEKALMSENPELIAVIGRRRVGKTFLVRSVYKKNLIFELSGVHSAGMKTQLKNFTIELNSHIKTDKTDKYPDNWIDAFELLKVYISSVRIQGKKVVFLDEFPWIETPRAGFISAFEHFWNSWASKQENLIVVICGSSASWMIRKIVNNKGGLHNRLTLTIRLMPFTLKETENFLRYKKVRLDRYQIIQLYMALGGIPYYLNSVQPGESAGQCVDRISFTKDGILTREFNNLFHSLFDEAGNHIEVIKALAKNPGGLVRVDLIKYSKTTTGGRFTEVLSELEESGFLSSYIPFGKTTKNRVFKLVDEFSFFYLKFMEHSRLPGKGTWIRLSAGNSWKIWTGFAWERICLKHTEQIKESLGIAGVQSEQGIWRSRGTNNKRGAQVDLYIDRKDHCINICETKFYNSEFIITKDYARELNRKLIQFKEQTKTNKTLFLTIITTFGIKQNQYSTGLIQENLTMDSLFE